MLSRSLGCIVRISTWSTFWMGCTGAVGRMDAVASSDYRIPKSDWKAMAGGDPGDRRWLGRAAVQQLGQMAGAGGTRHCYLLRRSVWLGNPFCLWPWNHPSIPKTCKPWTSPYQKCQIHPTYSKPDGRLKNQLQIIAGPCAIEGEEIAMRVAEGVMATCAKTDLPRYFQRILPKGEPLTA